MNGRPRMDTPLPILLNTDADGNPKVGTIPYTVLIGMTV